MRLSHLIAVCLVTQITCSLHAQKINKVQYSVHQSDSLSQRPKNYWIVDPPAKAGESEVSEVRIIVRFKGNPISNAGKNQRRSATSDIEKTHQQFINDLQLMDQNPSMRKSGPASKVHFEYREVFNGFAVVTTNAIAEEIKKLSYISYVTEDKKVQVSDLTSNHIINAPRAWSEFSTTGKGVTIGIIDTGIDYNHPDLGGGFGPGFKVVGGYDFVNNDSNPFDDHGHGTHVAGIAAANGDALKGVAPDAKLVAYKVLNSSGSGYDSWILAAIERSVDPDQNPNTKDALNVVNMSLGREPDPEEPLSEAVNNAVAQGVVFVIAAGNSYDNFTIGTPGIAEKAITVGATDNYDNTAFFSSKGPVQNTFALKPDLSAPGVDIYSSYLNGKYETLSGTSMASPHVAGAVALLLEQNPGWTPDIVKAALMNTAKQSYENIWNQGTGRLDIYNAITSEFIVSPGSISLGAPITGPSIKTIKAKVYNHSNSTKDFFLSIEGDIISNAVSATINTPSFSLNAKQSREVEIVFTINTSQLQVINLPDGFTGNLLIHTASQTVRVPIILLNPQTTKILIEGELPQSVLVSGTEGSNFWKVFYPTTPVLDLHLPLGKFDMISMFNDNHTVVTEGVVSDQNKTIALSKSLAKNRISFKPLDQHGNAIPIINATSGSVMFTGLDKNFMTLYSNAVDEFFISDNQAYRYEFWISGNSNHDPDYSYEISATTSYGTNESLSYSNNPSKFKGLNLHNPSTIDKQGVINYCRFGFHHFYITMWNNNDVMVKNPLKLFISETDPSSLLMSSYSTFNPPNNESGYSWETPPRKVVENKLIIEDKNFKTISEISGPSFEYHLGETLLRYSTVTNNSLDKVMLYDPFRTGNFNRFYGERELGTVYYKLISGERLIKEGNFRNSSNMSGGTQEINTPAQQYKMTLTYDDYQVWGRFGKATVELNFDTSLDDKDAPVLQYLSLDVAGKSVNQFEAGTPASIIAKIGDSCFDSWWYCHSSGIGPVSMFVKASGSAEWIELSVLQSDQEYRAVIPSVLPVGYYSYKLIATDLSGNSLTYELNPAFLIGNEKDSTPYKKVRLIAPVHNTINAGTNPAFSWSTLSSAEYVIQISEEQNFLAPLIEAGVKEATYILPTHLEENKNYYWRVKAISNNVAIPWSDIFSFYTGTLKSALLIYPQQDAQNEPLNIQFRWSGVDMASSYVFELSHNENFSEHQAYLFIQDTTFLIEYLTPDTQYFWRVSANIFTWDNNYYIPSATHGFRTLKNPDEVTAIDEMIKKEGTYNYPNPFSTNTNIVFHLDKPDEVGLSILDPIGRQVNFIKETFAAGKNNISWNGKNNANEDLPDGLYFGVLKSSKETVYIKMIIKR